MFYMFLYLHTSDWYSALLTLLSIYHLIYPFCVSIIDSSEELSCCAIPCCIIRPGQYTEVDIYIYMMRLEISCAFCLDSNNNTTWLIILFLMVAIIMMVGTGAESERVLIWFFHWLFMWCHPFHLPILDAGSYLHQWHLSFMGMYSFLLHLSLDFLPMKFASYSPPPNIIPPHNK